MSRGSTPAPWGDYIGLLEVSDEFLQMTWAPDGEQMRGKLYRQLMMSAALGYFLYFQADADYPD